ncbi:PPK2 family polyphosphate kinase [Ramlibacter sp. AN1133]|uniref:PPK2 family polyphosphate kinase n=1 Tax=Ramlibacter sp. AN1133 TaxID=3133429 RepID=UPI0030BC68D7
MAHRKKRERADSAPAGEPAETAWEGWRLSQPDAGFSLAGIDPGAKPFSIGDKDSDRQQVKELAAELDGLQNLFHADGRFKLLVVLQGVDTSGKDSTLRAVFTAMSPIGVRTVAWGVPSEAERRHDFLWRIHQQVPAAGEIVCFNRSHYEDVLVPVVAGAIDGAETARRYAQINDFERLLAESGTVILKFLLQVSKEEQRKRLQDRVDDPTKRWKFQRGDLEVRKLWDTYQEAYQRAIGATATRWAPWHIVPADSRSHRDLMVALAVRDALRALPLRYPDDDALLREIKVE